MSEEKDRVDGTADETKAQSRKDDYPSGKHQYLPGLHAEEL